MDIPVLCYFGVNTIILLVLACYEVRSAYHKNLKWEGEWDDIVMEGVLIISCLFLVGSPLLIIVFLVCYVNWDWLRFFSLKWHWNRMIDRNVMKDEIILNSKQIDSINQSTEDTMEYQTNLDDLFDSLEGEIENTASGFIQVVCTHRYYDCRCRGCLTKRVDTGSNQQIRELLQFLDEAHIELFKSEKHDFVYNQNIRME